MWLEDNERLVSVDEFGDDLPAVEAALKKHEAVCTDIKVRLWLDSVSWIVPSYGLYQIWSNAIELAYQCSQPVACHL